MVLAIKTCFQSIKKTIEKTWFTWKFKRLDEKHQERHFIDLILAQDIDRLNVLKNLNYQLHKEIEYHIAYVSMEPILISAQLGKKEVFDFLLENGANINSFDKNGKNALLFAILFQSPHSLDFVSYLLKKEVDIHHRDFDYKNALCFIKRAQSPLALYLLLREYGADIRQEVEKNKNYVDFVLNYTQWNFKKGLSLLAPKDQKKYEDFVAILELILPELNLKELETITNKLRTKRLRVEERVANTIFAAYDKKFILDFLPETNYSITTEGKTGESGKTSKKKINKI